MNDIDNEASTNRRICGEVCIYTEDGRFVQEIKNDTFDQEGLFQYGSNPNLFLRKKNGIWVNFTFYITAYQIHLL